MAQFLPDCEADWQTNISVEDLFTSKLRPPTPRRTAQGSLLKGWERRTDLQKHTYYVDHNTARTTWLMPCAPDATETLPVMDEFGQTLPAGWERRINQSGRIYYVDHNTRSTTWNSLCPPSNGLEAQVDNSGSGQPNFTWRQAPEVVNPVYYLE